MDACSDFAAAFDQALAFAYGPIIQGLFAIARYTASLVVFAILFVPWAIGVHVLLCKAGDAINGALRRIKL